MAFAIDATSESGDTTIGSSKSWSHANAGNYLQVCVHIGENHTVGVVSVTYDGTSMTLITGAEEEGGSGGQAHVYEMEDPPVGTHTVQITADEACGLGGTAISFTDAGGAGTPVTNSTNNSTNIAATASPASGAIVVDYLTLRFRNRTASPDSGQTVQQDGAVGTDTGDTSAEAGLYYMATTDEASYTNSNWTPTGNVHSALVVVPVEPGSSAVVLTLPEAL